MTIVGFNFTSITAVRKPAAASNINIESNAGISNVTELPSIDAKKMLLKIDFNFICKYEPGVGRIELLGEILEMYDKDFGAKILDLWGKNKSLHPEILPEVFNTILARSNLEAIVISRELGLPSPIQMPRIDPKPVEKKDIKPEAKPEAKDEKKKK